ncbi:MAG: TetR/AcrR family transcriptional regulator [Leptospiraceae bacterium]|nr:TetR/AcrR family transcriptional regulator [Leptospiraceae bacterium]MCP5498628.1 TetR/AcrR family transcriptional regulator [Leptospiraceae bacterium]
MNISEINYQQFLDEYPISIEELCRNIYLNNADSIKIKKEGLAVKNLQLILETVFQISLKKGFHAMSLRDLSKESGLSMGALYNYFSSKEELLKMIFAEGQSLIRDVFKENLDLQFSCRIKLKRAICYHLYLSEALQKVFYFLFMEAKNLEPDVKKKTLSLEQSTEKVFEDILKQGITAGEFKMKELSLHVMAIKALLQDWYLKRYRFSQKKINIETYASFVTEYVFSNLGR